MVHTSTATIKGGADDCLDNDGTPMEQEPHIWCVCLTTTSSPLVWMGALSITKTFSWRKKRLIISALIKAMRKVDAEPFSFMIWYSIGLGFLGFILMMVWPWYSQEGNQWVDLLRSCSDKPPCSWYAFYPRSSSRYDPKGSSSSSKIQESKWCFSACTCWLEYTSLPCKRIHGKGIAL